MTAITLEDLEQQHADLADKIAQFKAQRTTLLRVPEAQIELRPGEHYAGTVLDEAGRVMHHLVLLPGKGKDLTWEQAKEWAADQGGELPTRQEQALLFANCRPHLAAEWHWSSQAHETNASWAWTCIFDAGIQDSTTSGVLSCPRLPSAGFAESFGPLIL